MMMIDDDDDDIYITLDYVRLQRVIRIDTHITRVFYLLGS